jgi:lipopolysaccharide O-acetyltransferase
MIKDMDDFRFDAITRSLIYTKIFFRQARLIQLPFDIRNKEILKSVENFDWFWV